MKKFLISQTICLALCSAWLVWGPKHYTATALLAVAKDSPSMVSLGDYTAAPVHLVTGTVAHSFRDDQFLDRVASKHPEFGVNEHTLKDRIVTTPNYLNRTVRLSVEAPAPSLANDLITALLEERRSLDTANNQKTLEHQIEQVTREIESSQQRLTSNLQALQRLCERSGDPSEREAELLMRRHKVTEIQRILADLGARSEQIRGKLALVSGAGTEGRAGEILAASTGFEVFESDNLRAEESAFQGREAFRSTRAFGISEAGTAVSRHNIELARAEGLHGKMHPQTMEAAANVEESRRLFLIAVQTQRQALENAAASIAAATAFMKHEMQEAEQPIQRLHMMDVAVEYANLRQTIAGLEGAVRHTAAYRQMLLSARHANSPVFLVVDPALRPDPPLTPSPFACLAAAEIICLFLLWIATPFNRRRTMAGRQRNRRDNEPLKGQSSS